MEVMNLDNTPPFITMDGSEIRELLAHRNSAIRNQSLAEAGCLSAAPLWNTIIGKPRRFTTSLTAQAGSVSNENCAMWQPATLSPFDRRKAQALEHGRRPVAPPLLLCARLQTQRHHYYRREPALVLSDSAAGGTRPTTSCRPGALTRRLTYRSFLA